MAFNYYCINLSLLFYVSVVVVWMTAYNNNNNSVQAFSSSSSFVSPAKTITPRQCPRYYYCDSISYKKRTTTSSLGVYTPEQDEDSKAAAEANNEETTTVSDQVLNSLLLDKLDYSSSNEKAAAPPPVELLPKKKQDNKAMAFLRKVGKVGGAANRDFANACGSDEGSGMAAPSASSDAIGGANMRKALDAYQECTTSGIIDDLSQIFPLTSSGTGWRGVSDRVRGGFSNGFIKREVVQDKPANVLEGHVVLGDNGGFLQMVTDLPLDPSKGFVDASEYDGIELDVLTQEGFEFNVHLRTPGSLKQASFRHTVTLDVAFAWETVRIPFSSFIGIDSEGKETSVDPSKLKRIGIVALDKEMDVNLAIGGVRFYNVI